MLKGREEKKARGRDSVFLDNAYTSAVLPSIRCIYQLSYAWLAVVPRLLSLSPRESERRLFSRTKMEALNRSQDAVCGRIGESSESRDDHRLPMKLAANR